MIVPVSVSAVNHLEIHIFCDASEQEISAVAYLKVIDDSGATSLGFLVGKSKLAPLTKTLEKVCCQTHEMPYDIQ
jgi:hypothetical protein